MKKYFVAALSVVVIVSGALASSSDQSESIGATRIESFNVGRADIHVCLQRLSFQNKIPIGLEMLPEIKGSSTPVYFDIDVHDRQLGEVLDEIVARDSRYIWKVVDGTINVVPARSVDTFLDVVLPEFRLENATRESVLAAITQNEHFLARTGALGVSNRTITSGSVAKNINESSVNFLRQGASVREILNELIQQDSSHYWVVQIYGLRSNQPEEYYMIK